MGAAVWGVGGTGELWAELCEKGHRQGSLGSKTTTPDCQILLFLGHTWERTCVSAVTGPAHAGVGLRDGHEVTGQSDGRITVENGDIGLDVGESQLPVF